MHLSLFMQMIFTQGVVPSSFCVGDLTPIPKKGENDFKCSSFCPITVAKSLCKLFELLFINELETKCYTPSSQFGFKRRTGCANALKDVVSLLLDVDSSGESIALASHDINCAFDSLTHAAMLLKASQRGLNPCIVRSLRDMYSRLSIRLKLPPGKKLPPPGLSLIIFFLLSPLLFRILYLQMFLTIVWLLRMLELITDQNFRNLNKLEKLIKNEWIN